MFMNKKKNNTTTRLPMTGKVKKGFRFYCSLVAVLTIIAGHLRTRICGNF